MIQYLEDNYSYEVWTHGTDVRKLACALNGGFIMRSNKSKNGITGAFAFQRDENARYRHLSYSHGQELSDDGRYVTIAITLMCPRCRKNQAGHVADPGEGGPVRNEEQ